MTSPVNMGSDGQKPWVVTQADRDAAATLLRNSCLITAHEADLIRAGETDWDSWPEAFAKHRHEAQAELVEALRAILNDETLPVQVGFDERQNYVYVDTVRTDSKAFRSAHKLLAKLDQPS